MSAHSIGSAAALQVRSKSRLDHGELTLFCFIFSGPKEVHLRLVVEHRRRKYADSNDKYGDG